MAPKTATSFPDLPQELKDKIFEYTLPDPRTRLYHKWHQGPLALRICRSSRDIALKHYTACEAFPRPSYIDFTADTIVWESISPFAHFAYFFPETDNRPNIPTRDLGLVTSILVELDAWKGGGNRERIVFEQIAPTIATNGRHSLDTLDEIIMDALKLCPNLKEIVIEVYCGPDDEMNVQVEVVRQRIPETIRGETGKFSDQQRKISGLEFVVQTRQMSAERT